jgi:Tol biopolymer transport system component
MWEASMKLFKRMVTLGAMILLSACTGPSEPGTLIAFQSERGLISLVDPKNPCNTGECPVFVWGLQPTWSPDGRRLAFLHGRDVTADEYPPDQDPNTIPDTAWALWTMDSDGSHIVQQTPSESGTEWSGSFAWSPNGKWIAAVRTRIEKLIPPDGQPGNLRHSDATLYLVRTDGSGKIRPVAPASLETPIQWLPDGKHLLAMTDERTLGLLTLDGEAVGSMTIDTSHLRGSFFALSQDGQQLAFLAATSDGYSLKLRSIEALQRGEQPDDQVLMERRFYAQSQSPSLVGDVTWSPDGRYLMFAQLVDNQARLWLLRVADGDFAVPADFTACSYHAEPSTRWPTAMRPGFSADSAWLVFAMVHVGLGPLARDGLYVAPVEEMLLRSSGAVELPAGGYFPQWQP